MRHAKRRLFDVASAAPILTAVAAFETSIDLYPNGHPKCPCLPAVVWNESMIQTLNPAYAWLPQETDISLYGIGKCAPYDAELTPCRDPCPAETLTGATAKEVIVESPFLEATCEKQHCNRSFCYVDPENCDLASDKSEVFVGKRSYSYATCGDSDEFTRNKIRRSLFGKTIKVALLHNSGGWNGAYNSENKKHYEGPLSQWSGPVVDLVLYGASKEAGFQLELHEPPSFLKNQTAESLGSTSAFNLCTFATSLGHIDLCIAATAMTTQRALYANFIRLSTNDVALITRNTPSSDGSFYENAKKVFAPFLNETWFFIVFVTVPILGLFVLFHEYGGPVFPEKERVILVSGSKVTKEEERQYPIWKHAAHSIYCTMAALLRGDFSAPVLSLGGKVHLIGILFFFG